MSDIFSFYNKEAASTYFLMPVEWFDIYYNLQNVEAKYSRLGTGLCVYNLMKDQHIMVMINFPCYLLMQNLIWKDSDKRLSFNKARLILRIIIMKIK